MDSVEHAPSPSPSPSPVTNADDDYATTDASVDQHSSNDNVSNRPAGSPVRKRPRAADDEADEGCATNSLFTLLPAVMGKSQIKTQVQITNHLQK